MQFSVTARNLEITPALRTYTEEKLSRLTRYLENIVTIHVVLSVNKHRQTAEVTLRVRDLTIRAEEEGDDLYSSIDLVAEKLERQILRYKERIMAHAARGGNRRINGHADLEIEDVWGHPQVVREPWPGRGDALGGNGGHQLADARTHDITDLLSRNSEVDDGG